MKQVVFFLEEPSAEAMLQGLLPRLLSPEFIEQVQYIIFQGKSDLEKRVERHLRAWQQPAYFIVLRDQDNGDCGQIKTKLQAKCIAAGKPQTLIRIACHELESWYLGDLKAVEAGLDLSNIAKSQNKKKYRFPDNLSNAAQELSQLTKGKYQKVSGSRAIGPHLRVSGNRSRGFSVFCEGMVWLVNSEQGT